jgi:hypothetical protein
VAKRINGSNKVDKANGRAGMIKIERMLKARGDAQSEIENAQSIGWSKILKNFHFS